MSEESEIEIIKSNLRRLTTEVNSLRAQMVARVGVQCKSCKFSTICGNERICEFETNYSVPCNKRNADRLCMRYKKKLWFF